MVQREKKIISLCLVLPLSLNRVYSKRKNEKKIQQKYCILQTSDVSKADVGLKLAPSVNAQISLISFSCRQQDNHANHIIVRNWSTSSFHAMD